MVALLAVAAALVGGVAVAATVSRPTSRLDLPVHVHAYWFGDSWTGGYSADRGKGYAQVASRILGWDSTIDAGSGTGYGHVMTPGNLTYPQRVAAMEPRRGVDIVILQGGINDEYGRVEDVAPAAEKTINALRDKLGNPAIVMIGPAPSFLPISDKLHAIDDVLADVADREGLPYISPLNEEWITADNLRQVLDPVTDHPSTEGHAYIAKRVVADLNRLHDGN